MLSGCRYVVLTTHFRRKASKMRDVRSLNLGDSGADSSYKAVSSGLKLPACRLTISWNTVCSLIHPSSTGPMSNCNEPQYYLLNWAGSVGDAYSNTIYMPKNSYGTTLTEIVLCGRLSSWVVRVRPCPIYRTTVTTDDNSQHSEISIL